MKIVNFEDACKALKLDPAKIPSYRGVPQKHKKALIAHYKLIIIAEALNEGWTPDWDNSYKYYPWFKISGGGFSYLDYGYDYSDSLVGSRLCYKSEKLARYAGENFTDLYRDYFMID